MVGIPLIPDQGTVTPHRRGVSSDERPDENGPNDSSGGETAPMPLGRTDAPEGAVTMSNRIRNAMVVAVAMALLATGCRETFEEATDGISGTNGVERLAPTDPAEPPVGAPGTLPPPVDHGLRMVFATSRDGEVGRLDGATVGSPIDVRVENDRGASVTRVVWVVDGRLFRADDWKAPYTLRYASRRFPLDEFLRSDQGLPGLFALERGSRHEIVAVVVTDGGYHILRSDFDVSQRRSSAPGPDVASPDPGDPIAPQTPTTTTAGPSSTSTTVRPVPPAPTSSTVPPTPTPAPTVAPTTTAPPPPTTTVAPPPVPVAPRAGAPWTIPGGARVSVQLPQGTLGPRTGVAVDPSTVPGISFSGGAWTMQRDWDETRDGGYLAFGAAALRPNGHRVLGFRIEVPGGLGSGHLIDGGGEVGHFEITNPWQNSHNSFIRHQMHAHHYIARGVVGDAIKVGIGSAHHHDAYIEMDVRPGGPNDKHYDGAQIFNRGTARLERIVIEWANAGTIANTTGALFTQQNAALTARDILVLNPGGTWQPVRLSGSGTHDVDSLQVIGSRQPNNGSPNKLAPTAAVKVTNGSGQFTLHNGIAGADDWLIE